MRIESVSGGLLRPLCTVRVIAVLHDGQSQSLEEAQPKPVGSREAEGRWGIQNPRRCCLRQRYNHPHYRYIYWHSANSIITHCISIFGLEMHVNLESQTVKQLASIFSRLFIFSPIEQVSFSQTSLSMSKSYHLSLSLIMISLYHQIKKE